MTTPRPAHLALDELIETLAAEPADKTVAVGYEQNDDYQPGGHGVFVVLLILAVVALLLIWAIPLVVTG